MGLEIAWKKIDNKLLKKYKNNKNQVLTNAFIPYNIFSQDQYNKLYKEITLTSLKNKRLKEAGRLSNIIYKDDGKKHSIDIKQNKAAYLSMVFNFDFIKEFPFKYRNQYPEFVSWLLDQIYYKIIKPFIFNQVWVASKITPIFYGKDNKRELMLPSLMMLFELDPTLEEKENTFKMPDEYFNKRFKLTYKFMAMTIIIREIIDLVVNRFNQNGSFGYQLPIVSFRKYDHLLMKTFKRDGFDKFNFLKPDLTKLKAYKNF